MYLEYFDFEEYPFGLTPNTHYFCNLPTYQEALNVLLLSLRSGEGFIKVIGEVGTGKTMLCRELLDKLDDGYFTAYISNPSLDSAELRKALAHELEIKLPKKYDQQELLNLINFRLLELNSQGKKVVVIVDEAQVLSDEALESLRLLSNLETESAKLLQIVLFGQTELDTRLKQTNLRQLNQRIAFSYYLRPINRDEAKVYIDHRLNRAGNQNAALFTTEAYHMLHKASKGIPRLINILCHKSLMAAYGLGQKQVRKKEVNLAVDDTDSIAAFNKNKHFNVTNVLTYITLFLIIIMALLILRRI